MSELLRSHHRHDEIAKHADAHGEGDEIVERHEVTSLHQSIAYGDVADADDEEENRQRDESEIEHGYLL
jgi:hypothetical protein